MGDQCEVVGIFMDRECHTGPVCQIASNSALPSACPARCTASGYVRATFWAKPQIAAAPAMPSGVPPQRLVENVGQCLAQRGIGGDSAKNASNVGRHALPRGVAQRPQIVVAHKAEFSDQASPDLGLGQRSRRRIEQGMPEMKSVVRKFKVEERRLGLLELARSRQDVVRKTRVSVIATSMTTSNPTP